MREKKFRIIKTAVALVIAVVVGTTMQQPVWADAASDAQQAQLLLLMQTPEYQAAVALQQAQIAQQAAIIAAQQAELARQQAAILAAQQAAWNAQLQAAQQVLANAQYMQASAVNQTYLLNATQWQQRAEYEAMINKQMLDYKSMLMDNYRRDQYNAILSFKGYNGL